MNLVGPPVGVQRERLSYHVQTRVSRCPRGLCPDHTTEIDLKDLSRLLAKSADREEDPDRTTANEQPNDAEQSRESNVEKLSQAVLQQTVQALQKALANFEQGGKASTKDTRELR